MGYGAVGNSYTWNATIAKLIKGCHFVMKTLPVLFLRAVMYLSITVLSLFFCPGGRPANWTDVSAECLSLIETLTNKLSAEVSLQAHLQQPALDPKVLGSSLANGHANGHAG